MKTTKIILLALISTIGINAYSQTQLSGNVISYSYDENGNRIKRKLEIIDEDNSQLRLAQNGSPENAAKSENNITKELKYTHKLYPNPSQDFINLEIDSELNESITKTIIISDISGKVIYEKTINNNSLTIDITTFKSGNYNLSLQTQESRKNWRIVKF
jgi:hypothetical protein